MNIPTVCFKRDINRTHKYSLEFFMYRPKGIKGNNSVYTLSVYPILYLKASNRNRNNDGKSVFRTSSFKITPKNIFKVVRFFNTILKWFVDDDKKDLFLINEDEELIYNADYNNLNVSLAGNYFDNCYIKAVPAVIIENNKREEGIYLYINDSTEVIQLTTEEIEVLFNILYTFRFTDEINNILLMSDFISRNKFWDSEGSQWGYNQNKSPFDK